MLWLPKERGAGLESGQMALIARDSHSLIQASRICKGLLRGGPFDGHRGGMGQWARLSAILELTFLGVGGLSLASNPCSATY